MQAVYHLTVRDPDTATERRIRYTDALAARQAYARAKHVGWLVDLTECQAFPTARPVGFATIDGRPTVGAR